jgi:hypothetical protein
MTYSSLRATLSIGDPPSLAFAMVWRPLTREFANFLHPNEGRMLFVNSWFLIGSLYSDGDYVLRKKLQAIIASMDWAIFRVFGAEIHSNEEKSAKFSGHTLKQSRFC